MRAHTRAYASRHWHTHAHTHTHSLTHTHMHTRMHTHAHTHTHTHMHMHMHTPWHTVIYIICICILWFNIVNIMEWGVENSGFNKISVSVSAWSDRLNSQRVALVVSLLGVN